MIPRKKKSRQASRKKRLSRFIHLTSLKLFLIIGEDGADVERKICVWTYLDPFNIFLNLNRCVVAPLREADLAGGKQGGGYKWGGGSVGGYSPCCCWQVVLVFVNYFFQ